MRHGLFIVLLAGCAPQAEKLPTGVTLSLSREGAEVKRLTLAEMTAIAPMADVDIDDPVYGRPKHYKAIPLKPLLKAAYGSIDSAQQFVIRATDGYAVPTTGEILSTDGAYLAFRDREVSNWEPIGPQKVSPAPLYLVWRGTDQKDTGAYPWPWAVTQIDAVSLDTLYAKASPGTKPSESVERGHQIVLHKCIKCHPINGQGGHLGPELNIPKNVTEYWPLEQIKAYVRDPTSLRYGNMPPNPDLTNQDLDDLAAYLSAMKDHKL